MESAGSAIAVLDRELSEPHGQASLLPEDPGPLCDSAAADIAHWSREGYQLVTVLDDAYPRNLRSVHDRPPLIFVNGRLDPADERCVAVVGSRRAGTEGLERARQIAQRLSEDGFTVVSGLAAGIDTAAHNAALEARGRTLAVIGTGLAHAYPAENAQLQQLIAAEGAVISQFWPDTPPSRRMFPLRNAVMSGIALGTVLVEASATSGARVQARLALAHGRPVFLLASLVEQSWARELATRPGVRVFRDPGEISATIHRIYGSDPLVE